MIPIGAKIEVKFKEKGSDSCIYLCKSDETIVSFDGEYYRFSGSNQGWKEEQLIVLSTPPSTTKPEELGDYESCLLSSGSTLTKVPTGHIMTSSSGHQLFIPQQQELV